MQQRRQFLQQMGLLAGAFSANSLFQQAHAAEWSAAQKRVAALSPEQTASDEDYWSIIQQGYTVNPNIINLNNGGVSPAPRIVQEAVERFNKLSYEAPSYYMWRILDPGLETVRRRLARAFGCDSEEIALVRNASEGLQTCQFGFDLQRGDEVLTTNQDYPRMITTWQQRERRDGIVFQNRERRLPEQPRGYYREYTVPTPGLKHRGARRIVCGGERPAKPDACYYTEDHYTSFRLIVQ